MSEHQSFERSIQALSSPCHRPSTDNQSQTVKAKEGNSSESDRKQLSCTMEDESVCHLLRLPPELRNYISELAFTMHNTDHDIDLMSAFGPSDALALTCREIRVEAGEMYKHAYQEYWRTGNFNIRIPYEDGKGLRSQLIALRADNMEHITKLDIAYQNAVRTTHFRYDGECWVTVTRPSFGSRTYYLFIRRDSSDNRVFIVSHVEKDAAKKRASVHLYASMKEQPGQLAKL